MKRTLPERIARSVRSLFLVLVVSLPAAAAADDYADARADLVAAYQAQDFAAMRSAAERALAIRPGHPGALFNLAFAQTLDDDAEASLQTLNRLLAMNIDMGIAGIDEFAAVRELDEWSQYAAGIEELGRPVGDAQVFRRYDVGDFIPEGIAVTPSGDDVYLGSIRHGDIVRLADEPHRFLRGRGSEHWSVFGMRLGLDTLWFASSAIEQFSHLDESDAGRTGLFAVDLKTGWISRSALLPDSGAQQVLGDFVIANADTFYATDQADGVLYEFSVSDGTFTAVVDDVFSSPQGLVLDASGDYLYVADYIGGLFRVTLSDGSVATVDTPETISTHGIDGLYRHGNSLIAVQNGIQPNRVARFDLSEDGASIVGGDILAMNLPWFDDPNLGQVVGDRFVFIANSHWPRFDREGNLPEGLEGPVILEISIGED